MGAQVAGGPAFPEAPADCNSYEGQSGMTLRDYFMAHAPAEPQKWFNPVMPPCPVVPSLNAVSNNAWRADLTLQSEWPDAHRSQEARNWFAEQALATEAQSDWQADFRKQLYVQWPAAWADAMLEQRKC